MKRREESLPDLAEYVERPTTLPYPDAGAQIITVLVKDQFIDYLPEDIWLQVRQSACKSAAGIGNRGGVQ